MSAIPQVPASVHGSNLHANHLGNISSNGHDKIANTKNEKGTEKDTTASRMNDVVVENFRPIKVIVIGAGYSGIYHGIRIPERIKNYELVIYEKNAGVGGTWYENRYPGCACDVPSHSYQYSFNPNPDWSSLYAPAHEIRAYLEDTAKKYSVERFIKLKHEVKECRYDEAQGKWHVRVQKPDGQVIEDTSDVLISARGGLNHIAWPEIDGLRSFEGPIMHSAQWDENYDFNNKRIGIIGSGSSAIQIIPKLQALPGTHLSCFIRSKTWISPPFGQSIQDDLQMSSTTFTPSQRSRFRSDSAHFQTFRTQLEAASNAVHALTIKGTPMQTGAQAVFEAGMRARLAKKPEYTDWLVPSFAPGCRRLTPGPGFLEALVEDNVSFIREGITRVTATGVETADGTHHDIDVLVCATGFHTAAAPPFPVFGVEGTTLADHWAQRATSYLSLATAKFPNLFLMLGPNSGIGSGSLTMMLEAVGDYAIKCIRKMQRENLKAMVVKEARVRDFLEQADAYFEKTVFVDECRSWYRSGKSGKVTGLWPGSSLHCIEALRAPRWEDFEYEYLRRGGDEEGEGNAVNQLAWLGNGWSVNQIEERDLAWYLREEYVQVPEAPLPEENEGFKIRAFSH